MTTPIAVLDADVLVPAALRDTLLRAATRGLYEARWSATILAELERTLINRLHIRSESVRSLLGEMRAHFATSEVAGYERLIDAMTNDDKDRHVLAAAVVAGAGVIVTGNVRHFPAEALHPLGIVAQRPDEFLISLFERDPATMVDLIVEQAAALRRPPQSPDDLLRRLRLTVPVFVERVRQSRQR